MSVLPGPIRQIGYVVTDLDRAIASWVELGVGPWLVIRGLPMRALYRGEPCETTLSLALSNSGELQVELIQQQDDTPQHIHRVSRSQWPRLSRVGLLGRGFRRHHEGCRGRRLARRVVRW